MGFTYSLRETKYFIKKYNIKHYNRKIIIKKNLARVMYGFIYLFLKVVQRKINLMKLLLGN